MGLYFLFLHFWDQTQGLTLARQVLSQSYTPSPTVELFQPCICEHMQSLRNEIVFGENSVKQINFLSSTTLPVLCLSDSLVSYHLYWNGEGHCKDSFPPHLVFSCRVQLL
jgi:hypothetical protein